MNYVLTGGAGHITKPLAKKLLAAGHTVTVIGRSAANLQELVAAGAVAAIGSIEDTAFLTKTFKGADAVYTMVPPKMDAIKWKEYIGSIGKNYADSIAAAGVKYVVNLSSVGAHLPAGCGPVSGLHLAELALNKLEGVNIKHLRPSYFYDNLFGNLGLIKQAGIMGANFSIAGNKFPIVATPDIAEAAAEELLSLKFSGKSLRYIASDEISTDAIAAVIGAAIGKPDLKWVKFTDEDAYGGMVHAGLPEEIASNYMEMNQALHNGKMLEEYWQHRPDLAKVKLNDFAKIFAVVYQAN